MNRLNSRKQMTKEQLHDLEDRATEIIQFGEQRKKRLGCVCGAGGEPQELLGQYQKD